MSDMSLNENWDLDFDESGDMVFVDTLSIEETSQASQFRLGIIRGELFEDENLGMPWITDMVDPQVSLNTKKQLISRTVLSSPGAVSVSSIEVTLDTNNNIASATFSGVAVGGEFGGSI